MGTFKDHFSRQSEDYSKYRPTYPPELFAWLASKVKRHDAAWDCGTGNGQAAVELAPHFAKVYATDPSENQLKQSVSHPQIEYRRAAGENCGLPDRAVTLITVAQALHWFDLEAFGREVRRVSIPGESLLAAWCYNLAKISPEVDAVVEDYYSRVVGPYWEPERRLVEAGYTGLPLPFDQELAVPAFSMRLEWSLEHLIGYLGTWSSTQTARKKTGRDPLDAILPALEKAWGDHTRKRAASWTLSLRAGKL